MSIREAKKYEMDSIYLMGKDAWGSASSEYAYLESCRTSTKYALGTWFCLEEHDQLVSSIIVYKNCLELAEHYYGFGSIATTPEQRNRGFASRLIKSCIKRISDEGSLGIFLFSEIGPERYSRYGFTAVPGNEADGLMFLATNGGAQPAAPGYF